MASSKKRITVYLDDEHFDRVVRTADALGESRASVVAGLVEAAGPMLERMAELAAAIAAAPDDVRATFAGAAEQLEQQYGPLIEQAQQFWVDADKLARGENPRVVIRGSES